MCGKRESLWRLLVLLGLMLVFVGCAAPESAVDDAAPDVAEPEEAPDEAAPDEPRSEADLDAATLVADAAAGQKIIQNARITMEVRSPKEAASKLQEEAGSKGGYVSDISERQLSDELIFIQMTIRIPADAFTEYHARVVDLGTVIDSRIWSEDVTEEYVDLQARLDNFKSEEEALRRILEDAETVDEMMSVRRQLTQIRGEIESLEGRLRYLDDRVSYSTLNINLRHETLSTQAIRATGLDNLAPRMAQAFIRGSNWLLNTVGLVLITFAGALPALFALTVLIVALWFAISRIRLRLRR